MNNRYNSKVDSHVFEEIGLFLGSIVVLCSFGGCLVEPVSHNPRVGPEKFIELLVVSGIDEDISEGTNGHILLENIVLMEWVNLSASSLFSSFFTRLSFLFVFDSVFFFFFLSLLFLLSTISLVSNGCVWERFLFAVSVGGVIETTWFSTVHVELISLSIDIFDPDVGVFAHLGIHLNCEVTVWCTIKIIHDEDAESVTSCIFIRTNEDWSVPCLCIVLVPVFISSLICDVDIKHWVAIVGQA